MTERELFRAFDYQRFSGNMRLQAVIDKAHRRQAVRELTDEELDFVAAAGVAETPKPKEPLK